MPIEFPLNKTLSQVLFDTHPSTPFDPTPGFVAKTRVIAGQAFSFVGPLFEAFDFSKETESIQVKDIEQQVERRVCLLKKLYSLMDSTNTSSAEAELNSFVHDYVGDHEILSFYWDVKRIESIKALNLDEGENFRGIIQALYEKEMLDKQREQQESPDRNSCQLAEGFTEQEVHQTIAMILQTEEFSQAATQTLQEMMRRKYLTEVPQQDNSIKYRLHQNCLNIASGSQLWFNSMQQKLKDSLPENRNKIFLEEVNRIFYPHKLEKGGYLNEYYRCERMRLLELIKYDINRIKIQIHCPEKESPISICRTDDLERYFPLLDDDAASLIKKRQQLKTLNQLHQGAPQVDFYQTLRSFFSAEKDGEYFFAIEQGGYHALDLYMNQEQTCQEVRMVRTIPIQFINDNDRRVDAFTITITSSLFVGHGIQVNYEVKQSEKGADNERINQMFEKITRYFNLHSPREELESIPAFEGLFAKAIDESFFARSALSTQSIMIPIIAANREAIDMKRYDMINNAKEKVAWYKKLETMSSRTGKLPLDEIDKLITSRARIKEGLSVEGLYLAYGFLCWIQYLFKIIYSAVCSRITQADVDHARKEALSAIGALKSLSPKEVRDGIIEWNLKNNIQPLSQEEAYTELYQTFLKAQSEEGSGEAEFQDLKQQIEVYKRRAIQQLEKNWPRLSGVVIYEEEGKLTTKYLSNQEPNSGQVQSLTNKILEQISKNKDGSLNEFEQWLANHQKFLSILSILGEEDLPGSMMGDSNFSCSSPIPNELPKYSIICSNEGISIGVSQRRYPITTYQSADECPIKTPLAIARQPVLWVPKQGVPEYEFVKQGLVIREKVRSEDELAFVEKFQSEPKMSRQRLEEQWKLLKGPSYNFDELFADCLRKEIIKQEGDDYVLGDGARYVPIKVDALTVLAPALADSEANELVTWLKTLKLKKPPRTLYGFLNNIDPKTFKHEKLQQELHKKEQRQGEVAAKGLGMALTTVAVAATILEMRLALGAGAATILGLLIRNKVSEAAAAAAKGLGMALVPGVSSKW